MNNNKQINWFPGHMAKATRNIQESLKDVDLLIEVVDARAIKATSNNDFNNINKPHLKVALKTDLADISSINKEPNLILGSTKDKGFKKLLIQAMNKALEPLALKKKAKGILKPTFYVMVVGLPNVGKSSLINYIAGKKVVIVGNKPAVTKSQSVIKITDSLFLQDNPGVFFKKVNSMEEGYTLALLNTIKKEVLPLDEVVNYCFNYLSSKYINLLVNTYGDIAKLAYPEFVKAYANSRHFVTTGNLPDTNRAIDALFDDFVNGRFGKINYEK